MPSRTVLTAVTALMLVSNPAAAGDGRLEINQACAEAGCFPGDDPLFPVRITQSGSYILTSNLLANSDDAIRVEAPRVTIDLRGFEIDGNVSCSSTPPTCTGSGGFGITSVEPHLRVKSGKITGFDRGLFIGDDARLDDLNISDIAGNAIQQSSNSDSLEVRRNRFSDIGGHAISTFTVGPVLVVGNTFDNVGATAQLPFSAGYANNVLRNMTEFLGGHRIGPNLCGDQVCGGARRYYMTPLVAQGNQPLTQCDSGFHMASLFELSETSGLRYDVTRGLTTLDSGDGPPAGASAWVRSGSDSAADSCDGWTDLGGTAHVARFNPGSSEWIVVNAICSGFAHVWCVED